VKIVRAKVASDRKYKIDVSTGNKLTTGPSFEDAKQSMYVDTADPDLKDFKSEFNVQDILKMSSLIDDYFQFPGKIS